MDYNTELFRADVTMQIKKGLSVIIPTFKRNSSLRRCLISIINQKEKVNEVIVIDNYDKNHALPIVKEFGGRVNIRYYFEKRRGSSFSRNLGIKKAQFDTLAFIDDDCVADKNWSYVILKNFKNDKFIYIGKNINADPLNFFSSLEQYSTELFFKLALYSQKGVYYSYYADTKNIAMKKSLLEDIPIPFDPRFSKFTFFEDVDFSIRLRNKEGIIVLNNKMIVQHYSNNTAISHCLREFRKGLNMYIFNSKWGAINIAFANNLQNEKILSLSLAARKKYLKKKTILYKILFNTFINIDVFIVKLGYYSMFLWKKFVI